MDRILLFEGSTLVRKPWGDFQNEWWPVGPMLWWDHGYGKLQPIETGEVWLLPTCKWVTGQLLNGMSLQNNHHTALFFLVGGWATPLKNMSSSIGMRTFPRYGKIKHGNQTTNQLSCDWKTLSSSLAPLVTGNTCYPLPTAPTRSPIRPIGSTVLRTKPFQGPLSSVASTRRGFSWRFSTGGPILFHLFITHRIHVWYDIYIYIYANIWGICSGKSYHIYIYNSIHGSYG